jgi:hypothetical protein
MKARRKRLPGEPRFFYRRCKECGKRFKTGEIARHGAHVGQHEREAMRREAGGDVS